MSKFSDNERDSSAQDSDYRRLIDEVNNTDNTPQSPDRLAGYRSADFNNLACGIERGDGAARSSLIGSVGEADSQGLLDKSLQNLEKSGNATVVRDQFGQPKEIVIDPNCGLYDRGTKTKVEIAPGGDVKVDGRDRKAADAESVEFARQYSDALVDKSFNRKGEKPLTAEQKEQTKALNHAILDGDPKKLSEAVQSILKNPESARRIIDEHGKSFTVYGASLSDGKNPAIQISDYDHKTTIDSKGQVKTFTNHGDNRQLSEFEGKKAIEQFALTAAQSISQSVDLQNEYDKKRTAKVNSPADRAGKFAKSVQELIDYDK